MYGIEKSFFASIILSDFSRDLIIEMKILYWLLLIEKKYDTIILK